MCQAIREMWNDGWNDGWNGGLNNGVLLSAAVFRAVNGGLMDNEQCNCSVQQVEEIRRAFGV